MTDQAVSDRTGEAEPSESPALAEPGDRGRTVIADAVVERIAVRAASDVDGVEHAGSGLGKVVGRQYPKASVEVAGNHARLSVEIAVSWPHPLAQVCASVRDAVTGRLAELTGMDIDAVHVTAAKVVLPEPSTPRRVQ